MFVLCTLLFFTGCDLSVNDITSSANLIVTAQPAHANITIDALEESLAPTLLGAGTGSSTQAEAALKARYLAEPAWYSVTVTAEGYRDFAGQHEVAASEVTAISVELERPDAAPANPGNLNDDPTAGPDNPAPGEAAGVLLSGYWQRRLVSGDELKDVSKMSYRPRGFAAGTNLHPSYPHSDVALTDAGSFAGWDLLVTYDRAEANERYDPNMDFLYLKLNRAATVGVIYYGDVDTPPGWLSDWRYAGDIRTDYLKQVYPVYTKVLPAGDTFLKPLGQKGLMYSVIFAEADGRASAPPSVPAGLEAPRPNQPCPAWVHDGYRAEGADGRSYATWHPQVDPTYWCYFEHEHGSDPATFAGDQQPLFNRYSAIVGKEEMHEGFKVLVFEDETHSAMITLHATSSAPARVCTRYHAFDLVFADKRTGEVVGDFAFKGDFGVVRAQDGFGKVAPMVPAACPANASVSGTAGSMTVPVAPTTGYESWRVDPGTARALPLTGGMSIRLDEAVSTCSDSKNQRGEYDCRSLIIIEGRYGARRWFDTFDGFGMDTTRVGAPSGRYCTDYTGARSLACDDPLAVAQYAKAGVKLAFGDMRASVRDPWVGSFDFAGFVRTNLNIENSLRVPN